LNTIKYGSAIYMRLYRDGYWFYWSKYDKCDKCDSIPNFDAVIDENIDVSDYDIFISYGDSSMIINDHLSIWW